MARTPHGMNTIIQVDPLTPEQFVFWAKGYVEGRGEDDARIIGREHEGGVLLFGPDLCP